MPKSDAVFDSEFEYFDEHPTEDPFKSDLQYKDEVVLRLLKVLEDYMAFSTTRDLLKLLAANL